MNSIKFLPLPISTSAKYLLTDSRTLAFPSESIFFAIKGTRNDGHQYIQELYLKGVREFVIEYNACSEVFLNLIATFENCKFWQVENAILCLQSLVTSHRNNYDIPVIGITGSNGKTIVKEWLAQLLNQKYIIVKSPKSYNSQIGVPLSVWQINKTHTLGIFEAGISQPGEMQYLEKVIRPTIGIFTNIGTAHDQFFENKITKINEKLLLFKNVEILIYCSDNLEIDRAVKIYMANHNPNCQLLEWSFGSNSKICFKIENGLNAVFLNYTFSGDNFQLQIYHNDLASIENLCHCIVLMKYLNFSWNEVQKGIKLLKPVSMRLELKNGINNSYLIDDSYNNDMAGLKLALDFMLQQKQHKIKIVILSDLLQSSDIEVELYKEIAALIDFNGVTLFIGIGRKMISNADKFPQNALFFATTDTFIDSIKNINFANSIILVKGARTFSFEKIVNALQLKTHETVLEINLDALTHNLNYFKSKIGNSTRIMAMVKAFAYGAGNLEVAHLLQFQKTDYLGVAYTDEGVYLRENGINLPIMVMNPNVSDYEKIIEFSLEPELYSLNKIASFCAFMEGQSGIAKIHVKLDTGMHRLGIQIFELELLINSLLSNPNIIVASIFSHLAASEATQFDHFTLQQIELFNEMANKISTAIGYSPLRHILNTAGISRFSDQKMDMVRLGVGLYGVGNTAEDLTELQTVGTLKTQISQVKLLEKGESVGYGRKGNIDKPTKVATIAIGYADGYDRRFGNGTGNVLINGVLCPTIGNICMDMAMIDVTKANANEGDEVIVFGKNPTIYSLAKQINTIPYEILTNVGERVKRVFFKE